MKFPTQFPNQTQNVHPGIEANMKPLPIFDEKTLEISGDMLKDKVAIITGSDSGIGRAVAVAYAKQGAKVVIVYYNEHEDAKLTEETIKKYGGECLVLSGNIADSTFCKDIVTKTISKFTKIDILVNNAAVQYEAQALTDITDEQFDKTFKTNVYGPFYLTRAVLPHLKCGACIINTSSIVAFRGSNTLIDYSMTKAALMGFTRSLSESIVSKGIRVNAVAPGPIWTPFIPSTFNAQHNATFGQNSPMKRAGQPVECAGAYVFLASDAASYISGQTIHINGGEIVNT